MKVDTLRRTRFVLFPVLFALTSPALAATRTLQAEFPAATIKRLAVAGGDGTARFTTHSGDTDSVTVRVEVGPRSRNLSDLGDRFRDWFLTSRYSSTEELVQALTLGGDVSGSTLTIALTPGVSAREERVDEVWTVTVPRRLALDLDFNAADVAVRGVAGGVEAEVNVGRLYIAVTTGTVNAEVNVGDVVVETASDSVGSVLAEASVGSTDLWIDKLLVEHDDPPGPGSEVQLQGPGRDRVRAVVNVGDATVRVR